MWRPNLINSRKNKGFTQVSVAILLKISVRQYQALEAGTSDGSVKVWEKLKKLFGKPIDYLLEQEVDKAKELNVTHENED